MTTKTKLTEIETLAAESHAHLTAAKQALSTRRNQLATAQSDELRILRVWKSGNDETQGIELLTARAEIEKASALVQFAERIIATAESAIVNDDQTLADLIAPAINDAYKVPLAITTMDPTNAPAKRPALVLIQKNGSRFHPTAGSLSGKLELRYYRDELASPLDPERLRQALTKFSARAEVGGEYGRIATRSHGDGFVDSVRIVVQAAYPELPEIVSPGGKDSANGFARRVASELEDRFSRANHNGVRLYPVPVTPSGTVENVVTRANETRVTVQVVLTAKINAQAAKDVDTELVSISRDLIGTAYAGLGRVEKAGAIGAGPVSNAYNIPDGRKVVLEVVFVSATTR